MSALRLRPIWMPDWLESYNLQMPSLSGLTVGDPCQVRIAVRDGKGGIHRLQGAVWPEQIHSLFMALSPGDEQRALADFCCRQLLGYGLDEPQNQKSPST